MNKSAIKTFAIESRKKLISEITHIAGLLGITKNGIAEPTHKSEGFEMYDIGAKDPYTIRGEQVKQRASLASKVRANGFDNVTEEVAYTWFNRIIAIRFMEVNDYLPTRVRVLSSETEGKTEPDIVTLAPEVDLNFTAKEKEEILQLKHDNKLDEAFRMLFIKQCNALNEILPELFEKTNDYTELLLSISFTNADSIIRKLVDGVDEADFKEQVEIIGWMYQYYNTELKDDTFDKLKKNIKITKERIPAATQLFTPDWIVRYMVENSLGRLWIEGHSESSVKENWKYYLDEAEQDPDVQLQLEKLREERKHIKPENIKVIDPCMGSGHILVYAFDVMMDIYKSCGYAERDAAKLILENNIYGLDIDDRAYQLAYFAVMMKARSYSRRILNEGVTPNLCAIQESNGIENELKVLSGGLAGLTEYFIQGFTEIEKYKVKEDFEYIIDVFKDAKEYGSILDVKSIDFATVERRVEEIRNAGTFDIDSLQYRNIILNDFVPLLRQAKVISQKYYIVVTNPPYMGAGGMGTKLSEYVKSYYPNSKNDLFAVFIEKCQEFITEDGLQSMITQHAWMFLSSYEKLRQKLMATDVINMVHLGAKAFEEIGGEVVQTTSFVIRISSIKNFKARYVRLVDYDNSNLKEEKYLKCENRHSVCKENFTKIPGMPIAYWLNNFEIFKGTTIGDYFISGGRNKTHNDEKYVRYIWEVKSPNKKWNFYVKGGDGRKYYGNELFLIDWSSEALKYYEENGGLANQRFWLHEGITWSTISSTLNTFRVKNIQFQNSSSAPTIFEKGWIKDYKVIGLLNCKVSNYILKILNPTISITVNDVLKLPYYRQSIPNMVDVIVKENIEISRNDWNSFEISWDFARHPIIKFKIQNTKCRIEESFNEWNKHTELQFTQLKANEEELNRIFIDIYALQDELTSEVEDKDITIRKADLERDIKSFISYAAGCMLGRYSLDVEGLAYAGGNWDASKYKTFMPDTDNIIPITDTEYFNDDIVTRFVEFVKVTFGADTLEENLDFIANAIGNKGNTSRESIRQYFLKDFYKDHVKIYQKKPIYWLFDSGKENGFKALIYMHRYNQDTVARVRIDYLHKTQKAIEDAISRAEMVIDSSANASLKAKAVKEKEKLVKQLSETRLYDQAIAHVASQRIAIDLDDGVTVNYAKFQGIEVSSEGKKASKIDLLGKI
jgi:type II restriction/modification system DNA methylase subunit YeeA